MTNTDFTEDNTKFKSMMIRIENYFLIESIDENGMAQGIMNDEVMGIGQMDSVPIVDLLRDGWIVLDFNEEIPLMQAIKIAEEYHNNTLKLNDEITKYQKYLDELKQITTMVK